MRISDWSSDVCSSDLHARAARGADHPAALPEQGPAGPALSAPVGQAAAQGRDGGGAADPALLPGLVLPDPGAAARAQRAAAGRCAAAQRSEEHTSELQSLMRISYAVFCLKKKIYETQHETQRITVP